MTKKAILCVDDEKIILHSLKAQMKKHFGDRYQYEFAQSGDEAWEVIEELHRDGIKILIIVSDWLMPNMKGDELLIQVHHKYPDIIKVMLTGQADREAVERTEQLANLYRCLHKPWTETELIETLLSGLGDKE
ncbi:two-component response regulator [Candidatus Moduliflexus flocculans]|uniref:Two-component response regulator n=1 Tax=Candidatus Moduliflexus flocculans TaxID=1499966 RepID=A0A081BMB7_9BACT|nr:two-component response regulator [Candidatus Moduliflexus flocculans]